MQMIIICHRPLFHPDPFFTLIIRMQLSYIFMLDSMDDSGLYAGELIYKGIRWIIWKANGFVTDFDQLEV